MKTKISNFISQKKLDKINKIISKSENNTDSYDLIEMVLIDDFEAIDSGTNRLVFEFKDKKKRNKYILKVAGDSHGIEANYREFYNGDLDEKRLTKSYSISSDGIALIQERVTPFKSKDMEKRKKDVRKMLKHLEDKILLVDCKLSNFKNFGYRNNGDVVLLDHGDTIPLTMYKNGQIVNLMEETNVSLRCPEYKKGTLTSKNPQPCGGKLEYSKNYDYFTCKKCGSRVSIHSAYRDFYGYTRTYKSNNQLLDLDDDFDPIKFEKKVQNSIKQYAQDKMQDKNMEEDNMKTKIINKTECQQIRGYWIPMNSNVPYASIKLMQVKRGDMTPKDFIEFLGLNPDDYKMNSDDHINSRNTSDKSSEEKSKNHIIYNKLANYVVEKSKDNFSKIKDETYNTISISDIETYCKSSINPYYLQKALKNIDDIKIVFFNESAFYIKFNDNDSDILDDFNDVIELSFSDINSNIVNDSLNSDVININGIYVPIEIINKFYDSNKMKFVIPLSEIDKYKNDNLDDDREELQEQFDTVSDYNESNDSNIYEEDNDNYFDEIDNDSINYDIEQEDLVNNSDDEQEEFDDRSDCNEDDNLFEPYDISLDEDYEDQDIDDYDNIISFVNELVNILNKIEPDELGYRYISKDIFNNKIFEYNLNHLLDNNNDLSDSAIQLLEKFHSIDNISTIDMGDKCGYDIKIINYTTVNNNKYNNDILNDIFLKTLESLDVIHLSLDNLKDKTFKLSINGSNGEEILAEVNLYSILEKNLKKIKL